MSILATISSVIGFALPIVTWFLRRAGLKEEEIKRFEESVRDIQARRADATRAGQEASDALEELRRKREERERGSQ
jgi:hypothetical protein